MKKSIIALGALALCGSVVADVSSANTVGFTTLNKGARSEKYLAGGSAFQAVGTTTKSVKLYDMKITGVTSPTKAQNFIIAFKPDTLGFDNANAFYWNFNSVSKVTGETGYWSYKYSAGGHSANAEVPHDTEFPAGTAFFCQFVTVNADIALQGSGQVWKPAAAEMDADGFVTLDRPTYDKSGTQTVAKYFFVANPFAVAVPLSDIKISGLSSPTKAQNFIQYWKTNDLKMDNDRAYYWNYNTASKVTGTTGCWAYKYTSGGHAANAEVMDAADIMIQPGEGFFCQFATATAAAANIKVQIKVPAAIKNL